MEVGVFTAMMMGAIPALLLMFYMLRPFEGLYADRSVFNSFVVGMAIGVVAGVMHVAIDPFALLTVPLAILIFVIGFAVFDQFLRVVLFNSPRFSGKLETTFYSTAFGLGYASMLAALWFYRSFTHPTIEINAWVIVAYLAAAFAFAVVHGSTGMLVGFGASIGEVWRFGLLGVGMQAVLNFLWYLALISSIYTPSGVIPVWEMTVISMSFAAAYGLFILRWTMKRVVPELLPKETMRLRRRLIRKMSRESAKE
ncbi:MAG: hypothetical protein GWN39_06075 [Thermoplasmata archaeon]|nr:hypothetical protein [Thermoplasmata archaeon]NIS13897.1 hypothetical protein [Thermoplasmata archaeon]NIS19552.1 hypothetical protein [Thermoplasmata archaeon]NIT76699.1 hypothetical protein [Thermoplasmata archaeon]NIV78318.1 hypothetical protein [Thermoplasmata archaeon]